LLVKSDSQLTADVIPYNRNDGGPGTGLLSLVEVPKKAIVPFMVNAFDLPEIYLENFEKK
jgi:hypothetical protein